jgi:hypothetical protein
MTIFEIVADVITGYDGGNSFVWVVQLYGFDLNESSLFYFILDGNGFSDTSAFFNVTNQSGSSSAMSTTALGSAATLASVPAIVTLIPSTVQTATSSSSPSFDQLTGLSREALGLALGIGIPGLISILIILFVLLKQKTLPDENPMQCTESNVIELSGDRNSRESPATGCS